MALGMPAAHVRLALEGKMPCSKLGSYRAVAMALTGGMMHDPKVIALYAEIHQMLADDFAHWRDTPGVGAAKTEGR